MLISVFQGVNFSQGNQKTNAVFLSSLFLVIYLFFNNLQMNYVKEVYGIPNTIVDNLVINVGILISGFMVYFYLSRAKNEKQLIAFLVGSVLLSVLLTYLATYYKGGALGSETDQKIKYTLLYLFFKMTYYYLLLAAISRYIYRWFGYPVTLFLILVIITQTQVSLTHSLILNALLSILFITAASRTGILSKKTIFFSILFPVSLWFIHPYLLDHDFPCFPVQLQDKLSNWGHWPLNCLIPLAILGAVFLVYRILPKRETPSSGLLELRSFITVIAVIPVFFIFISVKDNYLSVESNLKFARTSQASLRDDTPNIILITLDTTRQDHLSVYGYKRRTTPELEKFARKADLFIQAFSTSGYTYPSHASIFTGMVPYVHGLHAKIVQGQYVLVRSWNGLYLSPNNLTLAEILKDRGFVTAALSAHPFLYQMNLTEGCDFVSSGMKHFSMILSHMGLQFGPLFEKLVPSTYRELLDQFPRADGVTYYVCDWLKKNKGRPFYLFINYIDPHADYNPPKSYANIFEKEPLPDQYENLADSLKKDVNLYDAEIAYMDKYLGLLFDYLERMGLFDNSMIIVEGDHGESFGEHSLISHGPWVYNDVIQVPLIIKYPFQVKGRVHDEPVSLVDIFPTVLNTLGYPVPSNIQGRVLNDQTLVRSSFNIISEGYIPLENGGLFHRYSMLNSSLKLIEQAPDSTFLFNLAKDPYELDNLSKQNSVVKEEMKVKMDNYFKNLDQLKIPEWEEKPVVSKETIQGLKAIGYID